MTARLLVLTFSITAALNGATGDTFDHSHQAWNRIVKRSVTLDGAISRVDYPSLKRDPAALNAYLAELSAVTPAQYRGWTRDQRLAFLINAYNAFTVKLIVDSKPVDSIKDLGGWLSTPWKKDFFRLLGETRNLDDIEHGMIREEFDEPRIHFVVNCASLGCPPLRREAYIAGRLEQQLEDNTRTFLGDPQRNRFDGDRKTLYLSSIFKWYGSDFVATDGSVEAFVAGRITADPGLQAEIAGRRFRVRFLDYDWALNKAQ